MSRYLDDDGVFHTKWGLVQGRHDIPDIDGYIFDDVIEDPLDFHTLAVKADNWASKLYDWLDIEWINHVAIPQNQYLDTHEGGEWTIHIYVTGLTSALLAVIGAFGRWDCTGINFWHYNRDTGEYVHQGAGALNH